MQEQISRRGVVTLYEEKSSWITFRSLADTLPVARSFDPMGIRRKISPKPIAELMEQIGLIVYSSSLARELKPAQWAALRYFDSATPNVRTVSGFAEMNSTTTGSASQTVTTLVTRKCLERVPDKSDGRRHSLRLTMTGRDYLANDPVDNLSRAIDDLPTDQRSQLADIITRLYRDVYVTRQGEG